MNTKIFLLILSQKRDNRSFRLLDKEHQKEAMRKLKASLRNPTRMDFIKANTIANRAIAIKYGCERMIRKSAMTPGMLADRQGILEDVVNLMCLKEKYHLNISVGEEVYRRLEKEKLKK